MKVRLLLIFTLLGVLIVLYYVGAHKIVLAPFLALEAKVKLLSYFGYSILVATLPLSFWIIGTAIYQLFHPTKCKFSYHHRHTLAIKVILALGVLAVFPRAYLGHKINQANYVECVGEANYSARSSWRVYAKDINLCEQD